MTHRHLITDAATAATFILAGNAIFTLVNNTTEAHATYRVEAVKDEDGVFEVSLFTGSDNTDRSSYKVIGRVENGVYSCTLRDIHDVITGVLGAAQKANDSWLVGFCKNLIDTKARGRGLTTRQATCLERNRRQHHVAGVDALAPTAPKVVGFSWVKSRVEAGMALGEHVEFWTEGRCCTCGRRLTNPNSIDALEGPVCSRRRGVDLVGTVLPIDPEQEDA